MPEEAGSSGRPARASLLDFAGNALGGGIVGGVLGWQLLPWLSYLAAPWLTAHGLPLAKLPIAGAAIGAVLGAGAGIVYAAQRAQTRLALQGVALREGGQFTAAGTDLAEKLKRDFCSDNPRDSMRFGDVLREPIEGGTLVAGELTIVHQMTNSSSTSMQTAAYFESAATQFPQFHLQPRGVLLKMLEAAVGIKPIDFPRHPEFKRRYDLSAGSPERVRALFGEPLIGYLERHPGLAIRAGGAGVLVYRDDQICAPEQLESFLAQAKEIFRLLSESARGLAALPQPKLDAKATAQQLSGLIGKVVRAKLVTREDVETFVRQAPPRSVPPAMRRYCDQCGPQALTVMGIAFALAGTGFALAFAASGQWQGMLLGMLFVAVGTPLALFSNRGYSRASRLLRRGEFAVAAIEALEDTGSWTSSSGETYCLAVRFSALGQSRQATCRISGQAPKRVQRLIAEKKPAPILYDPGSPERILYLGDLITATPDYD